MPAPTRRRRQPGVHRAGGSASGGGGARIRRTPQGLPYLKPPYGRITAIDMTKGEIVWQVAHGETPDSVRNHPALKGLNIPRTGQSGAVGALVTKTLVDRRRTAGDDRRRTVRAARCCARTTRRPGKEVGAVYMPAPQSGSPMTYMLNGRQYIVVAVSGGLSRASTWRSRCPDS